MNTSACTTCSRLGTHNAMAPNIANIAAATRAKPPAANAVMGLASTGRITRYRITVSEAVMRRESMPSSRRSLTSRYARASATASPANGTISRRNARSTGWRGDTAVSAGSSTKKRAFTAPSRRSAQASHTAPRQAPRWTQNAMTRPDRRQVAATMASTARAWACTPVGSRT